jgi:L-asparaginase
MNGHADARADAGGIPRTRRVYIAYTGGTIGMHRVHGSYVPVPGYLVDLLARMPELGSSIMPAYDVREYDPLLDSSNMQPADWLAIARDIAAHHDDYDGFVVLHGTDTMAYTASALAFLLPGLRKPVVVTGSQIPLCEVRNDARENIITSLMIAAEGSIAEVCLCFGETLLRGCRATKVSADGLDAFTSPNLPPLGRVGIEIDIDREHVRPVSHGPGPEVPEIGTPSVAALRLFPGISSTLLRNVLQPPLQGLILEAYGAGNGPDRDEDFLSALREATDRGVVIVACTQCLEGAVHLGAYETGSALARAGVIGGLDMTPEAALAKLFVLLGSGLEPDTVRDMMQRDLCGELTRSPPPNARAPAAMPVTRDVRR